MHIHTPCPLGRAAVRYAETNNIPFTFTFHTHFPAYLKHYGVGFLEGLIWKYLHRLKRNAKGIIVPSRSVFEELHNRGFKNLNHIPHGVSTGEFSPQHKDINWKKSVGAEGKIAVLFVSRLVEEKNLRALREMPKFLKHVDKIKLIIVGDGPARKSLEKQLPQAHFAGYLTGKDLLTAYASSDIFIFPSMTETFGNVTAEALASGLPSICANKGGACELISEGQNGYLVDGAKPEQFAEKIDLLVENPELVKKMSAHALTTCENYKWQKTVDRYEKLYQEMTRKN